MAKKQFRNSDPTAAKAVGLANSTFVTVELQRRARLREAADARRNEAIRRRKAGKPEGPASPPEVAA